MTDGVAVSWAMGVGAIDAGGAVSVGPSGAIFFLQPETATKTANSATGIRMLFRMFKGLLLPQIRVSLQRDFDLSSTATLHRSRLGKDSTKRGERMERNATEVVCVSPEDIDVKAGASSIPKRVTGISVGLNLTGRLMQRFRQRIHHSAWNPIGLCLRTRAQNDAHPPETYFQLQFGMKLLPVVVS